MQLDNTLRSKEMMHQNGRTMHKDDPKMGEIIMENFWLLLLLDAYKTKVHVYNPYKQMQPVNEPKVAPIVACQNGPKCTYNK